MVFLFPVRQNGVSCNFLNIHKGVADNRHSAATLMPEDKVIIRFGGHVQYSGLERQAKAFVDEWDTKVGDAWGQTGEAAFNFEWEANTQNETALNQANERLRQICSDPAANQKVQFFMQQVEHLQDPILKKTLLVLKKTFDRYYSDDPETIAAGRKADEAKNRLAKVPAGYTGDPQLFGQYIAPDSPLPYTERCKQLVKAQNTFARLQAGSNGWDLGLTRPDEFNQLLDEMMPVVEEAEDLSNKINSLNRILYDGTKRTIPFRNPQDESRFLRFEDILNNVVPKIRSREKGKWVSGQSPYVDPGCLKDYHQPMKSGITSPVLSVRAIIEKTADRLGFSVAKVLDNKKSRFYTGEQNWGYCAPINAPKDVPVITNIEGEASWSMASNGNEEALNFPRGQRLPTVLHEDVMHGGAFSSINGALPRLLRTHDAVVAEGLGWIGEILLSTEPEWHKDVMQVDAHHLARLKPALAKKRLDDLAELPYYVRNARVTRALYRNPNQDMDKLFYKMHDDFREEDKQPGLWAWNAYFPPDPQLDATYAISALWMAQVAETLEKRFGGLYTKKAWQYMNAHLSQGLMFDWQESAIALTGKPLSVEPLRRLIRKTYKDVIQELKKMGPQNE